MIADVVVASREAAGAADSGALGAADVVLAVEIVSPGSGTAGRVTKPAVYALAGIPGFWRVELDGGPSIVAHRLREGTYKEVARSEAGERLPLAEPFPIVLDPVTPRLRLGPGGPCRAEADRGFAKKGPVKSGSRGTRTLRLCCRLEELGCIESPRQTRLSLWSYLTYKVDIACIRSLRILIPATGRHPICLT